MHNESLGIKQTYATAQTSGSYTLLSNQATITASGSLDITAGRVLSDVAGKINAASVTITAGRDASFSTLQTGSTYRAQVGEYSENDSTITRQLSQITTVGGMRISAGRDLSLSGTQASIGGAGVLMAGRDIRITSVTTEVNTDQHNNPNSKMYDKQVHQNQTVVGSAIAAGKSLDLLAGISELGTLKISGSGLEAAGAVTLGASGDIAISSLLEHHLSDTAIHRESSSFLKSSSTTATDFSEARKVVGSSVSGSAVTITSGKDLRITGSAVVGDNAVDLTAANGVTIEAATATSTESHHSVVKQSGFLSGDGFGFSIGTRTVTTDQQQDATTQSGQARSMVGSLDGNLTIHAGDAAKIAGSDLSAGHDIDLSGKSVTITPGHDDVTGKFSTKMTQTGFTLALGGSAVNAVQSAQSLGAAAGQTSSVRMKALAAASAAMTANDAVDDFAKNGPSVKVSLTFGHSESESTEATASSTHGGSVLAAGNNVTISATGDGKASNIDIVGSDIRAKGDVSMAADNQVNLLAAQDTESQHSQSKSQSASVGVAIDLSRKGPKYGLTASASASRGNVDGEGTTQVNSHVIAGDRLTIASGGDTNLKGAVASDSQVMVDIKGNLNIESLQDKATVDGRRESASVSVTQGVGASASVSKSRLHNDYASVQEQSGIRAGDGGFHVQVAENTDLKGGVISSSEQAIKDGSNSLTTATLSFSDIHNHDSHEASGVSLGLNVGKNLNGAAFSPSMAPGIGQVSGSQGSVTRSGISGATLTVAGHPAGQEVANLNRDVSTGKDTAQALTKGWTGAQALDEVGAQMQITSAAMPRLAKEIGDFAKRRADELKQQGNLEEAAKWAEGGIYRVATHAALGAMGGGLGGAAGAAAGAEAAPTLTKLQDALQEKLFAAGLGNDAANVAAKLIAGGTAAAIGGVAGGSTGAATGLNVDANNRQLHTSELSLAKLLAGRSGGSYTEKQIADAMRASGNRALNESVVTGMVVPLTGETPAGAIYDTEGMRLIDDGAGHSFLVQQVQMKVDPALAAYITKNTGGAQSPYAWEPSVLGVVPTLVAVGGANPFTPNSTGCITAECAAGVLGNQSHLTGQTQFLGGLQATGGAAQSVGGAALVGGGLASCAETVGVGCGVALVGGLQMLAGWDNVNAGTKTAIDAKPHATMGGELLQMTGLSLGSAELLYGGLQWGTGYGAFKIGTVNGLFDNVEALTSAYNDHGFGRVKIENNFSRDADLTTGLRPAENVNKLFADIGYDAPFTNGTYVNVSMSKPGAPAYMVVSDTTGQAKAIDAGKPALGAFATPDTIPSQVFARETLAITPSMKADVSRVLQVEPTGKSMVQIEGKVAPQEPIGIYPGNGRQVFFDYPQGSVRTEYVKPLGPTQLLPLQSTTKPPKTGQ